MPAPVARGGFGSGGPLRLFPAHRLAAGRIDKLQRRIGVFGDHHNLSRFGIGQVGNCGDARGGRTVEDDHIV